MSTMLVRVVVPADPRWLHVLRSVTVATAASRPLDADGAADVALVVNEMASQLGRLAGVRELELSAGYASDRSFDIRVTGHGEGAMTEDLTIEDWTSSLSALVVDRLTQGSSASLAADGITVAVGMTANP